MSTLPTTIGIEFTFVPKRNPRHNPLYCTSHDPWNVEHDNLIHWAGLIKGVDPTAFRGAHKDGPVVEVPSPIFTEVKEIKKFYRRLRKETDRHGLIARRVDRLKDQDVYYGTGGGHVHVGLCRDDAKGLQAKKNYDLIRNMMAFAASNPWMPWVFNEFMDDENANCMQHNAKMMEILALPRNKKPEKVIPSYDGGGRRSLGTWKEVNEYICANVCQKDEMFNLSGQGDFFTMEMRFFDAPRSWQQTQDHIDWAMAIYKHVKKLTDEGVWITNECPHKLSIHRFRTEKKTKAAFKATCELFGLEWSRYKKYMKNYRDRAENGVLR